MLAIAGSMAAVKGKGLTAGAWEELIAEFESSAAKMEACGEQLNSVNLVMETSFNALSNRRKTNFKKMAVLAAGATAPIEMLLSLWETEVRCGGAPFANRANDWKHYSQFRSLRSMHRHGQCGVVSNVKYWLGVISRSRRHSYDVL